MMRTMKIFVMFCMFLTTQIRSQECNSPLGMEDGSIKNSQITTTGYVRSAYGWQARLNKNIPNWGAWCVNTSGGIRNRKNYDQYIMIDLLNLTKITGIATQGRQRNRGNEWVKDYKLSYKRDDGVWDFYREKDNPQMIFRGNTDVSTVVRHNLDKATFARYIRVHPGYYTGQSTCMRLELYECDQPEVKAPARTTVRSEIAPTPSKTDELYRSSARTTSGRDVTHTTMHSKTLPNKTKDSLKELTSLIVGVTVAIVPVLIIIIIVVCIKRHKKETVEVPQESRGESSQNNQSQDQKIPVCQRKKRSGVQTSSIHICIESNVQEENDNVMIDVSNQRNFKYESGLLSPIETISDELVYVIPINRGTESACEEIKITSSGYAIPNTLPQHHRVISNDNNWQKLEFPMNSGTTSHNDFKISSSGYTDLNRSSEETVDNRYQKLLENHSDYVIPAEAYPLENEKTTSLPGYTKLDQTKRVQDDASSYQKLIKK